MDTMKTVGQVLRAKGHEYWWVTPYVTAYEALEIMAEKNIGALMVVENGDLVGVFSERDYARKVILHGKSSKNTQVGELMSARPVTIGPEQTIRECLELMNRNHIRHLPVVAKGLLTGMVSIRDITDAIISDQAQVIETLESYITAPW
jgi:CBS domain-containing protein